MPSPSRYPPARWDGWAPAWPPSGLGWMPSARPGAWKAWAVVVALVVGVFGPAGVAAMLSDAKDAFARARQDAPKATTPRRPAAQAARACPVRAAFRLTPGGAFGACRDRCARPHKGLDLFTHQGAALVAVADGRIVKASPHDRGLGGVSLTLQAADGTRFYYAHNQRNLVGLGAQVRLGQAIARVGRTGNAHDSAAHLHFELRPPGRGPVDPAPHIRRWCR
jgi:murein DD-endopeptidase MepM/ murein hydrolase activator NlpD